MSPVSGLIVSLFSALTLLSHVVVAGIVLLFVLQKALSKNKNIQKMYAFIADNYVTAVFVVSALATAGSLSFSEIAMFNPCKLCWFQRIAMYPIALVSLVSLVKNDNGVKKYILPLSLVGLVISGYHILVQLFPQALECSDEVAKCSAVEFAQYGYITIPVMSFTAFLLIVLLSLFKSKNSK